MSETEKERNEEDTSAIFNSILNRCVEKIMSEKTKEDRSFTPTPALLGFTDKIQHEAVKEYLETYPNDKVVIGD